MRRLGGGRVLQRLLVIDDHAMVREGLLQILRKLGPNVVQYEAQDAESALLLLETEESSDLVLLDFMLPGTNGLSLLGILRKRFPAVPVVVLTALARSRYRQSRHAPGRVGLM